jgi:transposase, IS6 family
MPGWYLRFSLSYRDVEELLAERACAPITSPFGGGSSAMARKWNNVCVGHSNQPTTVVGWMRPTSGLRASGCIYTGLWAPRQSIGRGEPSGATGNQYRQARCLSAGHRELKADGVLDGNSKYRPVQYLNNILEQDHRAIKRRVRASQHFRSFWGAWRTIAGYEAIHMIRKGQACCGVGLLHHFILGLPRARYSNKSCVT